jgi:hypothetical protein
VFAADRTCIGALLEKPSGCLYVVFFLVFTAVFVRCVQIYCFIVDFFVTAVLHLFKLCTSKVTTFFRSYLFSYLFCFFFIIIFGSLFRQGSI